MLERNYIFLMHILSTFVCSESIMLEVKEEERINMTQVSE